MKTIKNFKGQKCTLVSLLKKKKKKLSRLTSEDFW